jgi:hypothetical protein
MPPSSSSKLIVLTSELTVVTDLVRFLFFFFTSAVRVAATEVAAQEADIFPTVYRVRRGATTLDGALRDMVGASSSLPTIELETYSSTGGVGGACTSAASWTL